MKKNTGSKNENMSLTVLRDSGICKAASLPRYVADVEAYTMILNGILKEHYTDYAECEIANLELDIKHEQTSKDLAQRNLLRVNESLTTLEKDIEKARKQLTDDNAKIAAKAKKALPDMVFKQTKFESERKACSESIAKSDAVIIGKSAKLAEYEEKLEKLQAFEIAEVGAPDDVIRVAKVHSLLFWAKAFGTQMDNGKYKYGTRNTQGITALRNSFVEYANTYLMNETGAEWDTLRKASYKQLKNNFTEWAKCFVIEKSAITTKYTPKFNNADINTIAGHCSDIMNGKGGTIKRDTVDIAQFETWCITACLKSITEVDEKLSRKTPVSEVI